MIQTRRLLVGAAALGVALVASGCSTSPVVASVNSRSIAQTRLDDELAAVSSNLGFVARYDASQSNLSAGISVTGDAPGTYNAKFVAGILTQDIQASVIHQYLRAHGDLPSTGLVDAVAALDAATYRAEWLGFPPSYRATLVQRYADLSQLVPVSSDTAALHGLVANVSDYLFSQLCVRQVAVSVPASGGGVDFAASLAQVRRLASQGDRSGGAVTCYTPTQLEAQGPGPYGAVIHLGVGRTTAPQRTSYGYQIETVTRRAPIPYGPALARAASLELATQNQVSDAKLQAVLAAARVHVNPQYGTWNTSQLAVVAPSTLGANGTSPGG